MSGLTDFLFEGQAPPSVVTSGSSTTSMPQWMTDYAQRLLAGAGMQANEGYQTYQGPRVAPTTNDQNAAYGLVRQQTGAYQPGVQRAGANLQRGASASGAAAAQPYASAASQTLPQGIQPYLNPYTENVTNRARDLATRSWNEDIMPGINDIFVRNGTYASSGQADKLVRGGRDVVEGLQDQANASLADAYVNAGNQFQQDQTRQGSLGQLMGSLTGADADRSLKAGDQEMGLAELVQSLGLKDASALESIGQAQQGQTQKNYDTAYGDFTAQRDYPKQQIDWLSGILNGLPSNKTTTETKSAPLAGAEYQPSGLNQLASGATGIASLIKMFKDMKGT